MNVIIANMAIALPRSMVSEMKGQLQHHSRETVSDSLQISASTPGLFDSAALANVPVKKRPTIKPAKVGVKAQRKLKAK